MKAKPQRAFRAKLRGIGPAGAWTILVPPFSVAEVWGTRARVPVAGTLNGAPFRSSLMPRGDGTHAMMICKELKEAAAAKSGDTVKVVIGVDTAVRTVAVPADLKRALAANGKAKAAFAAKSYSWKREHVLYLANAKRPETRLKRLRQILAALTVPGAKSPRD